jgi:hypothetical protein
MTQLFCSIRQHHCRSANHGRMFCFLPPPAYTWTNVSDGSHLDSWFAPCEPLFNWVLSQSKFSEEQCCGSDPSFCESANQFQLSTSFFWLNCVNLAIRAQNRFGSQWKSWFAPQNSEKCEPFPIFQTVFRFWFALFSRGVRWIFVNVNSCGYVASKDARAKKLAMSKVWTHRSNYTQEQFIEWETENSKTVCACCCCFFCVETGI